MFFTRQCRFNLLRFQVYLISLGCTYLPALPAAECGADHIDEKSTVVYVVDGDTLKLSDQRSVRLIGINSPEINHKGGHSEPFSDRARDLLVKKFDKNKRVSLVYGEEKKDRYGRLLAHLFFENGASVQQLMLSEGLAAWIVVPPNTNYLDCYRQAELASRQAKRGIWGHGFYNPLPAESLDTKLRGFRFISGKITRIGNSKKSIWLNLGKKFALRISRKELGNFNNVDPQRLLGKHIITRGWVYPYKDQLIMRLRHAAALQLLP
jgi:micrococcal nuclease